MATWVDVCRAYAQDNGVDPSFVDALTAFSDPFPRGGPPPPPEQGHEGDFVSLQAFAVRGSDAVDRIADDLAQEVDEGQARLFTRRLAAVDKLLDDFDDPTGRMLRVGLRVRLRGILAGHRPRALRIRALADFYYSYAGRHHHQRQHHERPSWTAALPSLAWSSVAKGLQRASLAGDFAEGPVHINLLRLEPGRVRLEALDCRAQHGAKPFADVVTELGAAAAVSGGFFLYSETDITPPQRRYDPVDLLMIPGDVIHPPVFGRGAIAVAKDGGWAIERVGPIGMHLHVADHRVPLDSIHHRADATVGPACRSMSVAGRVVVDVGSSLPIPTGGFVVEVSPELEVSAGDRVVYSAPRLGDGRTVHTAVAGGPLLVRNGEPVLDLRAENFWGHAPPITFSQDETGDRNLLPRLGAGIDEQGRLLLAAVDGRNFDRALGMTLGDLQQLFLGLRCRHATNLDGGSSKRMVVGGQTLDLASTEIDAGAGRGLTAVSVRPVYTALMIFA